FSKSIGDEAGDHKGIHSGTIQGKAEFITASPDVLVNGIPVVRQGDLMISNNRNTSPEQLQQPGINWGDDADDEELVKLVENPQPNQINIDISGTDVATTLHGKICAGDKFHYVMAGDSGKDNGVLKRLAIANVKSGKFALYYQLADMQGGYLNIPLGSNVPSQPSDAEQSEIGQAENILVVVTPRWHNIKPNALNPPVKNYQSIASFDPAYRDFIAQELDEYHQKNSQEKPWPEMISPTLKSLLQKELQPSHALILNPGWLYIYSQVVGEQNYTLWREIELLPEGKLRDVNLENNQGKEERAATSEENTQLIFPHKINNQQNKFCLAYSQVQWSWERIKYFEDSVNQMELNKRFDFLDLAHFVEPTEENYLFVSDPIGLVNNLQQDLTAAWLELKDLMAKTKDSPEFKSALLTYQIFYNPNYAFNQGMSDTEAIDSKVALAHGMTPNELTEPNENKKCQQDLDQAKLENILQVKERKALRIRIRYLQQALIELMQQDDFTTAFIDFFAASIAYYPNSFSALAGLLTFTSSDPATLDQNLDVATDYDSNQMLPGQNYFFDLFNAEHPFYNKLFPTEQKLADGAGVFNQEKFAATLELHDALSEAMAMAIKSLLHVQALTIKHLSSAVINKMQETLLTLAHATNNEYLTAVELVNPADMAENSDIIGYDNQILDRFVTKMNQRDETKAGAIEVLQRKISVNNGNFNYDHAETIATTHTSEHAYKDFRGVKNTETITATAVRKNILKLFEKTNTKVLVHKEIEQGLISADKIA
ncbi:MAG: DUF4150 domain-containing protein, partial [Gammaproteobacteria bacterium]|nr:DUF4150 domain-containing protein [Gammaproteobacteria bacterium]